MITNTTPAPELNWLCVLSIIILPGMFGGILSVLHMYDVAKILDGTRVHKLVKLDREDLKALGVRLIKIMCAITIGMAGGAGGAFAVLLVGLWTGRLDFSDTCRNRLLLCSLGVVAGYLGYRLLKSVALNLEKVSQQAQNAEKTAGESRNAVTLVQQELESQRLKSEEELRGVKANWEQEKAIRQEEEALLANAFSITQDCLTQGKQLDPSEILDLSSPLHKVLLRRATDRRAAIILANLHDIAGQHDRAIEVITDVLDAREAAGMNCEAEAKNVSDLHYNRACYKIAAMNGLKDPSAKSKMKQSVIDDIQRSITLSPSNRISMLSDDDFKSLHDDPEFKQLTGS